jgi:putative DNA primase/helicase
MSDLGERCTGRWGSILSQIGIDHHYLRNQHGPCPVCGGKDRFRWDDKEGRGTFYCNHCGAGDGIKLVMLWKGCDFAGAARVIEPLIGTSWRNKVKPRRAASRYDMRNMWANSSACSLCNTAGRYLFRRCGIQLGPSVLRHVDALRYWGDEPAYYPAMLALVSDVNGKPVQLHRTYLSEPDQKAPVAEPRRMMPGSIPRGSAVRLGEVRDGRLGIAEGIETALCAAMRFQTTVWAAIGTGGLLHWVPPAGVDWVTIYADRDKNFAGQAAAYQLAHRLMLAGIEAAVEVPPSIGDFADLV